MSLSPLAVQKIQHPLKARMLQVRRVTPLNPDMVRITLGGDDLAGFLSASFDDHVKLFLPPAPGAKPALPVIGPKGPAFPEGRPRPVSRDYTPRLYDAGAQELHIDFVLHHSGPATDWAAGAKPGDFLGVAGPRGSFIIPHGYDWHLLIGDETAIPAIGRRLAELPAHTRAIAVIKTRNASARTDFETRCGLDIEWVLEEAAEAGGMDALERAVRAVALPAGEGYAWAAGEYTDIKRIREHLVEERGIDKSRIRAASYWRKAAEATHVNFE
ncbi:siderophore-interacting protein [Parapusillimonas granuli]|uniref:Siderophore-interacting protein n=1 Tax=Parapusillimonas granuli TaxID=380911 RepID=A0A853G2P9_9BURK|nr:siderophore-interacting protein [Parapusillimonas granuli]MBB5214561.1 NADPH-dependent ferric siderophore reductase [Parapusillimonas granuli]MEB2398190.1 siderophore-interacting protein [Alcaligenaceae bacterium]NYT49031.1 siderophore-interacting protein [Parapusillimonas granuli]